VSGSWHSQDRHLTHGEQSQSVNFGWGQVNYQKGSVSTIAAVSGPVEGSRLYKPTVNAKLHWTAG
jgi:hypothetical protein